MLSRSTAVVFLIISITASRAQQPAPTAPTVTPTTVTALECAKWRETLSKGQPLAKDDESRFVQCAEMKPRRGDGDAGIFDGISTAK
jgi:hypothetical protein